MKTCDSYIVIAIVVADVTMIAIAECVRGLNFMFDDFHDYIYQTILEFYTRNTDQNPTCPSSQEVWNFLHPSKFISVAMQVEN